MVTIEDCKRDFSMVKKLNPNWTEKHPSLLKELRLRYIYHTNAIEGNLLSLIETNGTFING